MGLSDWFGGSGSGSGSGGGGGGDQSNNQLANGDWEHSHYEVKRFESGGNNGWQTVNVGGQEKWGYPVSEQEFRANMPDLEPGKYRLWSVDTNGLHHPPRDDDAPGNQNDVGWVIEVEPKRKKRNETDEVKRELQQLRAEMQDGGGPQDPETALEQAKAQLAVSALQSEEFINKFGADIALQAFGVNRGGESMGYEEWSNDKLGATIFQLMEDPQKAEQMGKAIGSMGSSFVGGMLQSGEFAEVMGGSSGDGSDDESSDEQEADPERGRLDDLDAGASSFDDLAPPDIDIDEDQMKENFARAEKARKEAEKRSTERDESEQGPPMPSDDESPPQDEEPDRDESEPSDDDGFVDVERGAPDDWPTDENGDPVDPEKPSDFQTMRWQTIQKLGSKHGYKVEEFDRAGLTSELERELFGTDDSEEVSDPTVDDDSDDDSDDAPANEYEKVESPPSEDDTKIAAGGSSDGDGTQTPDDIAAQL